MDYPNAVAYTNGSQQVVFLKRNGEYQAVNTPLTGLPCAALAETITLSFTVPPDTVEVDGNLYIITPAL
jgi:hypothetical protein